MRIALLSCFYPYRGGISQFNANLLAGLGKCHDTRAWNFKRQYPAVLFPGKTQYVTPEDDATPLEAAATLDTVNPLSWGRTARSIRAWQPDAVILPYWMSWFAPSLGWIARRTGAPCLGLLHNAIPHEPHFFDKPLTRYFLRGCKGFICLADGVKQDLEALQPGARSLVLPHPLYTHFGEPLPREQAALQLGLDPGRKTLLFFGLIREYKGLDLLLEAFRDLPEDYQLVIAGEPYGSFEPYQRILDSLPGKDRVHLFLQYIPDAGVKNYFSAADAVVLPYRSATQSGICAIANHFGVPQVVTPVGDLPEAVGAHGTGIVASAPGAAQVREAVLQLFRTPEVRENCQKAILQEQKRLGWDAFCRQVADFAAGLKTETL